MRKKRGFRAVILLFICWISCGTAIATTEARGAALSLPEDFWRYVDGGTSIIPISEALFDRFDGTGEIVHHKTTNAYVNLLEKRANLVFALEPSEDVYKMFEEAGVELELTPIVKEAFVLFVNVENPTRDLTVEQLKDIYTGRVMNWKKVGGEDLLMIPYQRNFDAGSQVLFMTLLMQDEIPLSPPTEYLQTSMKDIIDAVAYEDRARAAIGFNVFYYANDMYENEKIRMLKVNGVEPSPETIASGEYPLATHYYAAIRKDTPPDDPIRQLITFILTDEGQALMKKTGYVPVRGDLQKEDKP